MNIKKVLIMSVAVLMLLNKITPAYTVEASASKVIVKNEVTLTADPYLLDFRS